MNVPTLLADHNRNSEKIQTLEAATHISVSENGHARPASGKLAFERERNFKLHLSTAGMEVADIGSNDQEFWIWVNDRRDPAVYYCDYDENGASPLSVSFQPDWIIQAMGLRVIPDSEMSRMKAEKGLEPDTVVIRLADKTARGESIVRETLLRESTGRIIEHRIYGADGKTQLALAAVTDFQDCKPATEEGTAESAETVYLPKNIKIEWTQEKLTMNVALKGVHINPKFDAKRAADLFVEPKREGIDRRNLADRRLLGAPPSTTTRETLPAPTGRIELGRPMAIPDSGAMKTSTEATRVGLIGRPSASSALDSIVGPSVLLTDDPLTRVAQAPIGSRVSLSDSVER
jgi:hypothetical protein